MGSKINEIKNSPEEKRIQQELKDSANYTVLVWSLVGLGVIAIVVLFVFVFVPAAIFVSFIFQLYIFLNTLKLFANCIPP